VGIILLGLQSPPDYQTARDADILSLHRWDGSLVAEISEKKPSPSVQSGLCTQRSLGQTLAIAPLL
jgi:hypothetical protein